MSRIALKTACILLLSAGAALAQTQSLTRAGEMAPAAEQQNTTVGTYGDLNIHHAFTGGRIAGNAAPIQVQEDETASLANIPAGM